jgi:hypothetical protein
MPTDGPGIPQKRWAPELLGLFEHGGTSIVIAGLGVVSSIRLPRLLGPQGRGELAAVTLWPITLIP